VVADDVGGKKEKPTRKIGEAEKAIKNGVPGHLVRGV